MPWDQTQTIIRSGHRNPEDFDPQTLKTITLSEEEGIQAITGKAWNNESTEVVSYLFNKEKGWTVEKAQEWFKEHEKKAKESFSWTGTIKNIPQTGNLIRGKALPNTHSPPARVAPNKRIPQRRTRKIRSHISGRTPNSRPPNTHQRQSPRSRIRRRSNRIHSSTRRPKHNQTNRRRHNKTLQRRIRMENTRKTKRPCTKRHQIHRTITPKKLLTRRPTNNRRTLGSINQKPQTTKSEGASNSPTIHSSPDPPTNRLSGGTLLHRLD